MKFCDERDKKVYKYVTINVSGQEQRWMAENLNYNVEGSVCYGEGSSAFYDNQIQQNCRLYGRLYSWVDALAFEKRCENDYCISTSNLNSNPNNNGICPDGWHIPSNTEWLEAQSRLQSNGFLPKSDEGEGGHGYYTNGTLVYQTQIRFWTSTEAENKANVFARNGYDLNEIGNIYKTYLYSVRCMKEISQSGG